MQAVDCYRQAIVRLACERNVELLDIIASNILSELPEYGSGRSQGDIEDIRAGVQRSIDLCLRTIAEGRRLDDDERVALRFTGGQRARQGIPKPAMLTSVKIATRVGRAFLMTCTDVGDDAEALMAAFRQITEILDGFEDDTSSALAQGHDEVYSQVLSAGDRGEAMLVDRLLEHRFDDEDEVLRHAADIGLSRSRDAYVVVVASLGVLDEARLRATVADVRSRALLAVGPLRYTHRVHLPFIVQPRDRADWEDLVDRLARIGQQHSTTLVWSERVCRLTSLSPAYRTLRDGLPFLAAATSSAGAVPSLIIRFHRVICAGSADDRLALLADVLGPLHAIPERECTELLETLDSLYETGGSAAALARHLHLHKNTVGNRLRRVKELVGLDVRRPAERLVLETVLRMRHVADVDLLQADSEEWLGARTA